MNRNEPDIYALVGYPLGHSFSRDYFTEKFDRKHIDAQYLNFEIPDLAALPAKIAEHPHLRGFNVTIPYKQATIPMLDSLDPVAEAIGAVNCVKIARRKGTRTPLLTGYNTDAFGFSEAIRPSLRPDITGALVLGTGGASRAVVYALQKLGISSTLVSRSAKSTYIKSLTYADLTPDVMADNLLIVNTTPLGMSPNVDACPDIPYNLLTPRHLCFDLIYNPDPTLFLKRSSSARAEIVEHGGLDMLTGQAEEAWRIWHNQTDSDTIIQSI